MMPIMHYMSGCRRDMITVGVVKPPKKRSDTITSGTVGLHLIGVNDTLVQVNRNG